MNRTLLAARLALLAALALSQPLHAGPIVNAGPGKAGGAWVPGFNPASAKTLTGIQAFLRSDAGAGFMARMAPSLGVLLRLKPDSEAHLSLVGAMGLPADIDARLAQAPDSFDARVAVQVSLSLRFAGAERHILSAVDSRADALIAAVKEGTLGVEELSAAAAELAPFALHASVAGKVKAVADMADAARAAQTIDAAKKLAAGLMGAGRENGVLPLEGGGAKRLNLAKARTEPSQAAHEIVAYAHQVAALTGADAGEIASLTEEVLEQDALVQSLQAGRPVDPERLARALRDIELALAYLAPPRVIGEIEELLDEAISAGRLKPEGKEQAKSALLAGAQKLFGIYSSWQKTLTSGPGAVAVSKIANSLVSEQTPQPEKPSGWKRIGRGLAAAGKGLLNAIVYVITHPGDIILGLMTFAGWLLQGIVVLFFAGMALAIIIGIFWAVISGLIGLF